MKPATLIALVGLIVIPLQATTFSYVREIEHRLTLVEAHLQSKAEVRVPSGVQPPRDGVENLLRIVPGGERALHGAGHGVEGVPALGLLSRPAVVANEVRGAGDPGVP